MAASELYTKVRPRGVGAAWPDAARCRVGEGRGRGGPSRLHHPFPSISKPSARRACRRGAFLFWALGEKALLGGLAPATLPGPDLQRVSHWKGAATRIALPVGLVLEKARLQEMLDRVDQMVPPLGTGA